jgi:hypothetical protein
LSYVYNTGQWIYQPILDMTKKCASNQTLQGPTV